MSTPPFGDFGPELNNLLNQLGCFCSEHAISVADAQKMIDTGIAAVANFRPEVFGIPAEQAKAS